MSDLVEAFEVCANNLSFLPSKYKKWKNKLELYRIEWNFIYDFNTREGLSEQEMALDYLWSLGIWLKPKLTLEFPHKLLFIQGLGSIYEAVLRDLWKNLIYSSNLELSLKSVGSNKFEKDNFENLISNTFKAGLINEKWCKYLHNLRETRNLEHIVNRIEKRSKLQDGVLSYDMKTLKSDLVVFRGMIRKRYIPNPEIPF